MKTLEELQEELKSIDKNIEAGRRFEDEGHDCSYLLGITYQIRSNVVKQIKELTDESSSNL